MKTENYTMRVLTPESEDGWLTESADVAIENRTLSKRVYLSATSDASAWVEISDAEAKAYQAAKDAAAEKVIDPDSIEDVETSKNVKINDTETL
jgi:hypothetical protein